MSLLAVWVPNNGRPLMIPTDWIFRYGSTLFDELGARAFLGLVHEDQMPRSAIARRFEGFDL